LRFLAPFRRVTTSGSFIAEIDGLRFIAIGSVLLFHLAVGLSIKSPQHFTRPDGSLFGDMVWNGFRGVELFFVISGFILALPFAGHALAGEKRVSLKGYFLRRVTRLEPPYVLCMVLFFLMFVVRGQSARQLFPHLAASLVYLHNLIFGTLSPINDVTWSLEIEIQFYVLTPLLAKIFFIPGKVARRAAITALGALFVVAGWYFILPGGRAYYTILRFLQFFLIGFLLADVYLTDWKGKPAPGWIWDAISIAGWPLLFAVWHASPGREPLLTTVLVPPGLFLLYCAAFRGPLSRQIITNPWITTIGGMCYSIYLLHNHVMAPLITGTRSFAPTGIYAIDLLVQFAIVGPITLIPCAVYFLLIEKPCMRRDWPQRLWQRLSGHRSAELV
jgi:peptidoglycan/LPS O-acetylase OafA/YrhL